MILGIDVSTTKIGWSIIDLETKELINSGVFKTDSKEGLEERGISFRENVLKPIKTLHNITIIRIEEPFSMFSGGKTTANTMSSLQRFNGMISILVYDLFSIKPELVGARVARSRAGIKVPKGEDAKKIVTEWVQNKYSNFKVEYTKHGNPKPGTDDEADAIVIAYSHFDVR